MTKNDGNLVPLTDSSNNGANVRYDRGTTTNGMRVLDPDLLILMQCMVGTFLGRDILEEAMLEEFTASIGTSQIMRGTTLAITPLKDEALIEVSCTCTYDQ